MGAEIQRDRAKWALFAVLGFLVIWSAYLDDSFILDPRDPEWHKLATWWPLLPHAIAGVVTLMIGPWQFSDRLRARRPRTHRILGRIYVVACFIAAPLAGLIAWQHHPLTIAVPQLAQSIFWFVATAMALANALRRNFAVHRLWMMRSYGFCMVFVVGRLPDLDPNFNWSGIPGVTVMWAGVVLALIVPDLILNLRSLWPRAAAQSARAVPRIIN